VAEPVSEGLAAKRAAGVRLGRPSVLGDEVVRRIIDEGAAGETLRAVAEGLTADGVPTARGGDARSTSTVQGVLRGQDAARIPAEVTA
jgi:DNA invertase Pin-like site-specific DNA recombinase